jgi:hypothetical protein
MVFWRLIDRPSKLAAALAQTVNPAITNPIIEPDGIEIGKK